MRLLLVDGHYYAYRSFYAIQNLTNSRGEPTNAVYGMVKALKKMLEDVKPDLAAVIFDEGLPEERMVLQADYKANRAETPEALEAQFPVIDRVVSALGYHRLSLAGEEADDLIASYVKAARAEGIEVVLATNDKDLMQLVDEGCSVYQSGKEGFQLLGPAGVEEKWLVPPGKIGEVLALTGDAVDNIPGVPGVGPKTAAVLVREFGDVESLLAGVDRIKSEKTREAVRSHADRIRSNRVMVALRDHLPLPLPVRSLTIRPDPEAQVKEFRDLEFRTFLREAEAQVSRQAGGQGDLFG
jgi:DNA polymerase-1